MVIGLLLAALAFQCPDGSPPPCSRPAAGLRAPAANSVAVLYFDNLSRDTTDTYLADGLTEEVIVRLQHIPRLDVKTRYDVQRFRGTRITDSRATGRTLGAAYLVTGSVRPSPSRMRVSYELVRTSDGRVLASDIVDTTATDPFAISNAVALAIAGQVAGRLAPEERAALVRSTTRDAQAVDLYRRGNFALQRGLLSRAQIDRLAPVAFFRAAIDRDSTFTDAWAGLADAWTWIGDGATPNRFAAEQCRVAALRALALDSTNSKALASLSYPLTTVDYDWARAERLLRRAIAADPHSTEARQNLALLLTIVGRFDEAWSEVEQSWASDSLSPRNGFFIISLLLSARRYGDLLRWSGRAHTWARNMRFFGYLGTQRVDSAMASAYDPPSRVMALAAAGRTVEARAAAAALAAEADTERQRGETLFIGYDDEAAAWSAVGDKDRAFEALEHSYAAASSGYLMILKYAPIFDNLRGDPRYHDLLRRMRLE